MQNFYFRNKTLKAKEQLRKVSLIREIWHSRFAPSNKIGNCTDLFRKHNPISEKDFCDKYFKYAEEHQDLPINERGLTYDELKAHYQRGGLGDVKVKKFLIKVLEEELKPIRERRAEYEKNIPGVFDILREGTEYARKVGKQTLAEVKAAMKINYFEDEALIKQLSDKFAAKHTK